MIFAFMFDIAEFYFEYFVRALKCPLIYDVIFWNRHIMICPPCGNKLEGSFEICPECGFKLSALTEKNAQGRCHIITVKIILTLVQGVHLWYHRWIFNRWENLLDIKHKCIFSTINKDFMNIFPTQYSSLCCYKNVNDCLVSSIYICIVKKKQLLPNSPLFDICN